MAIMKGREAVLQQVDTGTMLRELLKMRQGDYIAEDVYNTLHNAFDLAASHPSQRQKLQSAIEAAYDALCPPPCASISPEFWGTPDGELLITAEFLLYKDDLISIAQAARILFSKTEISQADLQAVYHRIERGLLHVYYRPASEFIQRRSDSFSDRPKQRGRMLRRSEVERLALKEMRR